MYNAGKCKDEIEKVCKEVDVGEGRLADCIGQQMADADDNDDKDGRWGWQLGDTVSVLATYLHLHVMCLQQLLVKASV